MAYYVTFEVVPSLCLCLAIQSRDDAASLRWKSIIVNFVDKDQMWFPWIQFIQCRLMLLFQFIVIGVPSEFPVQLQQRPTKWRFLPFQLTAVSNPDCLTTKNKPHHHLSTPAKAELSELMAIAVKAVIDIVNLLALQTLVAPMFCQTSISLLHEHFKETTETQPKTTNGHVDMG